MNKLKDKTQVFFVGPEVSNTPANSKKTLFVIGQQSSVSIEETARKNLTPHIYLGADHSFKLDNASSWDNTITALLDKGFMVTLEYEAHMHEHLLNILNPGVWQSRLFIPLLSVRVPKIQSSNPNLTIKIDDSGFSETNDGIWCLHYKEVSDSNRFTAWNEFEFEEAITSKETTLSDVISNIEKSIKDDVENNRSPEEDLSVKNDSEAGLDFTPTSALKPAESSEDEINRVNNLLEKINPEIAVDAAELYAEGTTDDPIAKETKKTKAKR